MNSWSPLGAQGIEEKRNLGELRGNLEGLFCTYCVSSAQIHPPVGLLAHPQRVGCAFIQYVRSKDSRNSQVWPILAQNGQKVLKKGVPPVLASFSGRSRAPTPPCRRNLQKSGQIPPAGPSAGGNFPIFFSEIRRTHGPGARDLPRIVFSGGGGLKPPVVGWPRGEKTASGRPNRRGGTPKSCKVPESGVKKGGTPI